jgi:hypothetical protein
MGRAGLGRRVVQVGDGETMLDMAAALATKAARDGGEVVLEVYPDEGHTFQNDQRNAAASGRWTALRVLCARTSKILLQLSQQTVPYLSQCAVFAADTAHELKCARARACVCVCVGGYAVYPYSYHGSALATVDKIGHFQYCVLVVVRCLHNEVV